MPFIIRWQSITKAFYYPLYKKVISFLVSSRTFQCLLVQALELFTAHSILLDANIDYWIACTNAFYNKMTINDKGFILSNLYPNHIEILSEPNLRFISNKLTKNKEFVYWLTTVLFGIDLIILNWSEKNLSIRLLEVLNSKGIFYFKTWLFHWYSFVLLCSSSVDFPLKMS